MPRLNDEELADVLGAIYFQAVINKVYSGQAKADIIVNNDSGTEIWEEIPLYYHCEQNPAVKRSGGLDGADVAFEEGDNVIVKVERDLNGEISKHRAYVIGFTDKLEPCGIDLVRAWTSIIALRITFTYTTTYKFVEGKTVYGDSASGTIAHISTQSNTMYIYPYLGDPDKWGSELTSEDVEGNTVKADINSNVKYAIEVGEVLDDSPYTT